MQHIRRSKWVLLTLVLCVLVGAGALLAQDHAAGAAMGAGVTFVNNSHHDLQIFARYGGSDDSCLHQPKEMELHVAAGSSGTVDSGDSKVCFCLDVPDRNACPNGWATVKANGKRVFQ
jgi:hypothetical protein